MRDVTAQELDSIKKIEVLLKMFDVENEITPVRARRRTYFCLTHFVPSPVGGRICLGQFTYKSTNALASGARRLIKKKQQIDFEIDNGIV